MYLEMAQVILLALSPDRRVQLINRRGCESLGRREMDLLGRDWLELAVPTDQQEDVARAFRDVAANAIGDERYFEHDVLSASGERRLIAWRCIAIRNASGHLTGFFSSGEDITESRKAEEEAQASQARMTQVSRLATMGEMAAGIAHELNQPLAAIANYANAALRLAAQADLSTLDPDGDVRMALDQISQQALRAGEIIRRLRALVQNRETRQEPSNLNDAIAEVIGFVAGDAKLNEVRIVSQFDPSMPIALLDRIQIQQIALNLLRNSIEALVEQPRGQREIRLQTKWSTHTVQLVIEDNGPGVPADLVSRIFDPFCTTKATGTGLGLAISRTIAEAHRGKLSYDSPVGGGARFTLTLPYSGDTPR